MDCNPQTQSTKARNCTKMPDSPGGRIEDNDNTMNGQYTRKSKRQRDDRLCYYSWVIWDLGNIYLLFSRFNQSYFL